MKEIIFAVNVPKLRKALSDALKHAETGCYFIFKKDVIEIAPRECHPLHSHELPVGIQANYRLWIDALLVPIEDVAELIKSLKQEKEKYIKGKAVFDDTAGFIEIEDKKMFAYYV